MTRQRACREQGASSAIAAQLEALMQGDCPVPQEAAAKLLREMRASSRGREQRNLVARARAFGRGPLVPRTQPLRELGLSAPRVGSPLGPVRAAPVTETRGLTWKEAAQAIGYPSPGSPDGECLRKKVGRAVRGSGLFALRAAKTSDGKLRESVVREVAATWNTSLEGERKGIEERKRLVRAEKASMPTTDPSTVQDEAYRALSRRIALD